jgi:hypothetical protein
MSSGDDVAYLARSANRVRALELLSAGAHDRRFLKDELGVSTATVNRILDGFEAWVERDDGKGRRYRATTPGALLSAAFGTLLDEADRSWGLAVVLRWLPVADLPFDPVRLADATVTLPAEGNPIAPVHRVVERMHLVRPQRDDVPRPVEEPPRRSRTAGRAPRASARRVTGRRRRVRGAAGTGPRNRPSPSAPRGTGGTSCGSTTGGSSGARRRGRPRTPPARLDGLALLLVGTLSLLPTFAYMRLTGQGPVETMQGNAWQVDFLVGGGMALVAAVLWLLWRRGDWGTVVPGAMEALVAVTVPYVALSPFWNVSGHVIFSVMSTLYLVLVDRRFWPLLLVPAVMVPNRVYLDAHTWAQAIGALLMTSGLVVLVVGRRRGESVTGLADGTHG